MREHFLIAFLRCAGATILLGLAASRGAAADAATIENAPSGVCIDSMGPVAGGGAIGLGTRDETAAGLNELGLELEANGRHREAAAAFSRALRFPDADRGVRGNLARVRVRWALKVAAPVALGLFLSLCAWRLLAGPGRCLLRAMLRAAVRWALRRVRLRPQGGLSVVVLCANRRVQRDHRVYPDSATLRFTAALRLPRWGIAYPLSLRLRLVRPDGTPWRSIRREVGRSMATRRRPGIAFQVGDPAAMLRHPGTWRARLVVGDGVERVLGERPLEVVGPAELSADLAASEVQVVALRRDGPSAESVILADDPAIAVHARIAPRRYDRRKYKDVIARVCLSPAGAPDDAESREIAVDIRSETPVCLEHRVSGDPIAERLGAWEARVSVDGRVLATAPFAITTQAAASAAVSVESIDLAASGGSAPLTRVGDVVDLRQSRSVYPLIALGSPLPSARLSYLVEIVAFGDDKVLAGLSGRVTIESPPVQITPGELPLAAPSGRRHGSSPLRFLVWIDGRLAGEREVVLRHGTQPCADAEGRIVETEDRTTDWSAEAAAVLGMASVP